MSGLTTKKFFAKVILMALNILKIKTSSISTTKNYTVL